MSTSIVPGIQGGSVLPTAPDLCAAFQYYVLRHLANRVHRAVLFCQQQGWVPPDGAQTLVLYYSDAVI